MDAHRILNVNPGCTPEEARAAYIRLAKIHHPDRGGNPEKFQEIQAAYEIVKNGHPVPTAVLSRDAPMAQRVALGLDEFFSYLHDAADGNNGALVALAFGVAAFLTGKPVEPPPMPQGRSSHRKSQKQRARRVPKSRFR